jgi:acetylornithine deacetylase/succinyl-diaminopimelate desuccinylase-like protein
VDDGYAGCAAIAAVGAVEAAGGRHCRIVVVLETGEESGSPDLVTGTIGADSNMHVPDEWLNIPFARRVTEAVAHVLDAHARRAECAVE